MTTFFKKLFGSRPSAQPVMPSMQDAAMIPARELFIEDRHPQEFLAPDVPKRMKREKTILEDLLAIDYAGLGQSDGYADHDLALLDLRLELIASDFRQAFDRALQDIESELEQLGVHLTELVEDETPSLFGKIQARHQQLTKQKVELITQKDLAVIGEGYVEKPYRYYKVGFRKGYELYLEEQVIFKHIKTL